MRNDGLANDNIDSNLRREMSSKIACKHFDITDIKVVTDIFYSMCTNDV